MFFVFLKIFFIDLLRKETTSRLSGPNVSICSGLPNGGQNSSYYQHSKIHTHTHTHTHAYGCLVTLSPDTFSSFMESLRLEAVDVKQTSFAP